MAEGKKSFIFYTDWKETFEELPDDKAGLLIKHILAYVSDENPQSDDVLIKAVFANFRATLKRDLKKWDKQHKQRVEAGKRSAEKRKEQSNDRSTKSNDRSVSSTVSGSVSGSVSVNDNVSTTLMYNASTAAELMNNDESYIGSFGNGIPTRRYIQFLLRPNSKGVSQYETHCKQNGKDLKLYSDHQSHLTNWARKKFEALSPPSKNKYR